MAKPSGPPQNEAALVCAAREGDREALLALLQRNWLWLKGLTYNLVGSTQDTEEVLQNVCVLVIEKIGTVRQPERFKAWLATVARHAALAYRQQMRKRPLPLDEAVAASTLGRAQDIGEKLDREQQHAKLLEAMRALPEKYRETFVLRHLNEMSYDDMAEILDVPVSTVQIRLVRARRMIHNHLMGRPNNKIPRT